MSQTTSDAPPATGNASGADFANFDLPETMLVTLAREGLVEPTPIQALSIPLLLDGKDLIGLAQTGTGKTAAFLLPLMTHLGLTAAVRAGQPPKALILAPTRELANQISQNVQKLAADLNIRHIAIFGGARYDAQIRGLRRGVDIVVATPGRLQDLMERGAFDPSGITHFVLDEADHMLDLGFYPAIKRIAASLPAHRQTMLFSATMPPEIEALGQQFLRDPARVKAPQSGITADKVTQHVTLLAEGEKRDRLCEILHDQTTGQALIFVRTKRRADALAKFLSVRGFAVDALHGDMRQTLRQKVLRNFRGGDLQALIATDVAARGIDVAGLSHVVNFDLTDTPEAYVHRIGRTGRAGLGGLALSFCAPDEQHKLAAIISVVGGRVELFAADGTRVEDFKAVGSPSRQRRRGAKSGGHKFARKKQEEERKVIEKQIYLKAYTGGYSASGLDNGAVSYQVIGPVVKIVEYSEGESNYSDVKVKEYHYRDANNTKSILYHNKQYQLKYPENNGLCQTGLKIHNHKFTENLYNIGKDRLSLLEKLETIYQNRFDEMTFAITQEMGCPNDFSSQVILRFLNIYN